MKFCSVYFYPIFTFPNANVMSIRILLLFLVLCITASFSIPQEHTPPTPVDSVLLKGKADFLGQKTSNTESKKPNIILILADDLGKYDLSVYGNLLIETPNIDRLAREGAIFTDGYATASVCSPSRAGLMTGRYQQRFGYHLQPHPRYPNNKAEWWLFKNLINTGDLEPADFGAYPARKELPKNGLPQSEIALSELLKKNGYATAWIGKWHLGYAEPLLPKNFDFDYRYGFYEAYSLFAPVNDKNIVNARINEFTDKHIWNGGRKGVCAIRENEKIIDEKKYITYAFADKAKAFIATQKNNPFFLYLPFNAPHTPYQAPKEIYDKLSHIPEHSRRVYYAMIIAMDNAIGEIMKQLEAQGIAENTLVIFTSDNGAALYSRTVTNAPLNGGKFTLFEGGLNVPFIMYHKGKIQPKTVIHHPVNQCDIYTTVADWANAELPQDRVYDGVSLRSWLQTEAQGTPHEALYWLSDYNSAMRMGNWKLIVNTLDKTIDLYDLSIDHSETKNVAEQQAAELQQLNKMLKAWAKQMPSMYWPRIMDYRVKINGKTCRWAV